MNINILKRTMSVYMYLAVAASVLFFLYMNLPYWYDRYQTSVTYAPFIFLAIIATASALFLSNIRLSIVFLKTPYAKWCIAVMLVHILNAFRVHFLDFHDDFKIEAIDRIQLFALAPALAYLLFRVPSQYYSKLIGITAILCPITLFANYAYPGLFETAAPSTGENQGNRISGFWLNPNIAGEMVILAILMAYQHVSRNFFTIIVLVGAIGIILTASRSGAIAILFIVLPLLATRKMPLWILGVVLVAGLSFQTVVQYFDNIAYDAGREGSGLVFLDRVDNQIVQGDDSSTESRLEVAAVSISESLDKFFLGHGHNYNDLVWEVGTHNMLLAWAYLYGASGVLLWAYLAFALFRKTFNRREMLLPFTVFVWYSMFSHNILLTTQWFIFFGWIFFVTSKSETRHISEQVRTHRSRKRRRRRKTKVRI